MEQLPVWLSDSLAERESVGVTVLLWLPREAEGETERRGERVAVMERGGEALREGLPVPLRLPVAVADSRPLRVPLEERVPCLLEPVTVGLGGAVLVAVTVGLGGAELRAVALAEGLGALELLPPPLAVGAAVPETVREGLGEALPWAVAEGVGEEDREPVLEGHRVTEAVPRGPLALGQAEAGALPVGCPPVAVWVREVRGLSLGSTVEEGLEEVVREPPPPG